MLPFLISTYVLFVLTLFLPPLTTSAPSSPTKRETAETISTTSTTTEDSAKTPLLPFDFPDPCIIQDPSTGLWYAFATGSLAPNSSSTFKNIQAARAPSPLGPWTYLVDADPLPDPGPWTAGAGSQTWAPSVQHLAQADPPSFVMYYSGQLTGADSAFHCVGAAVSTTGSVLGPYAPLPVPLVCPLDRGGAIDPAGFVDPASGRRYLLYKVDGNARGGGGECNNGVEPRRPTPIVLQEVDPRDGVGLVGNGVVVLDRAERDGPLVEAPEMVYVPAGERGAEGSYLLFYSNHCWDGPGYSVNYAVAGEIAGPYRRREEGPLIRTGDGFNITAPGGAGVVPGGGWMLFHGDCPAGRCLFGADMVVEGEEVIVS
ncbi:putative arabinan endo-1,5-alpha-L-arabinosidase C [Madurella mycetomatis]|uniref:Arabinan endo-1,5-alpha-L-arabinosidase C n=1 Tax=Madurella mycetomatis TaxID=100816 RepID=A0A175WHV9_9PEZI|nr:putative arabinan endo-1,5-alpha-L-arabinosidase C [Madurella mycetomatis]